MDHILSFHTLIEQEVFVGQCLYSCFVDFKDVFDIILCDKLCARLQRFGVPPHLQHDVEAMYTTVYAKVQINGNACSDVMSNTNVKQGRPLSPTLFGLCIDELETCLDEIDGDSPCLFNIVVVIILYVDSVILLFKFVASLQRFMNMIYELCISSSF